MKTRNFLWGLLTCAVFSACSSDEVVDNELLKGGDSYVSIRLVTSNDGLESRGQAGNPEFILGTSDEATVTNSHFYFYDASGNFVVKGETVSSIADSYPNQTGNPNIETKGSVNVVLRNVQALPTSVLVVLNMSDNDADAKFKTNLNTSYEAFANTETGWGYTANEKTYFTMTNSSYMDGNVVMKATPVSTNHLQKTEALAVANPITICVERMAAKVNVTQSDNMEAFTTANGIVGSETVASAKTLNISVDAWGLNGVNKSSYYLKKIDSNWNYIWWNPSTVNYRSYWAEDANYNDGSYPTNAASHDQGIQSNTYWSLKYYSANEITQSYQASKPQYCLENTIGTGLLNSFTNSATHVIVLATMKIGTEAKDLFIYKGVIYDESNYKRVVLNDLTASTPVYKKENSTFSTITVDDVEINSLSDGKVNLKLKDVYITADTWYKSSNESAPYTVDELNVLFSNLNDADGYKEGKMYYVIPIEHLGSSKEEVGYYGVVRNHFYTININEIKNLGKGIYNPAEVIVPNYDPETYYVAATLNILSWKTINQNVSL